MNWSVGWSGCVWLGFWIDRSALVGDLSNVTIVVVSCVLDVLDSTIGKSNGVRSLSGSSTIGGLLSVEVRLKYD